MFAQNKNITIRAAEPYDADLIYNWENDQDIWRVSETYTPFVKCVLSLKEKKYQDQ